MLYLSEALVQALMREAEAAYPAECCGFLLGAMNGEAREIRTVKEILPAENRSEAAEQYHRFSITPEQMLTAERYARAAGSGILGFYHSHPDHPAIPSEYDRSHAVPGCSYPIVSVMQGKAAAIRCWQLSAETGYHDFTEELIERGED